MTEVVPETTAAERAVADELPLGLPTAEAERVRDAVPVWFHTFCLAPGVYTPGFARDHRYRLPALGPERFAGKRVLDTGTFDGFYAYLAESRGAARVVGVDNEQYVDWIRGRFEVDLPPAAGFDAVHAAIGSQVAYARLDAEDVGRLGETFDVALCFGMLHRVREPLRMLQALADVLAPGGEVVLETYGSTLAADAPALEVRAPGDVYAGDDHTYWGFPAEGLRRLATFAGLSEFELVDQVTIDAHPRIIAILRRPA